MKISDARALVDELRSRYPRTTLEGHLPFGISAASAAADAFSRALDVVEADLLERATPLSNVAEMARLKRDEALSYFEEG